MTSRTGKPGMSSDKLKACCSSMIKSLIPSVHAVARIAFGRKSCRLMIHQLGIAIVFYMASGAFSAEAAEEADRSAFMAIFALQRRMSAH
jgi:hypothetical protein